MKWSQGPHRWGLFLAVWGIFCLGIALFSSSFFLIGFFALNGLVFVFWGLSMRRSGSYTPYGD